MKAVVVPLAYRPTHVLSGKDGRQSGKAGMETVFEWVRMEHKGKGIKIAVQPNTTGKNSYFHMELK